MIDALVIGRDKDHLGGVVTFVELLMENFSSNVRATRFVIGREPHERSLRRAVSKTFRDALRLVRIARTAQYDVIHLNPSLNLNALLRDSLFMAVLLAAGAQNIVFFVHGWEDAFVNKIKHNRLKRFALRSLLGRAAVVLVLASQFKQELCELGLDGRRIRVLTTMFDRRLFEGVRRRRFDFRPRILFLSRLIKEKGIQELLTAFLLLVDRLPALELVIAGDGPEEHNIRRWIEVHNLGERVKLTGYLRGHDKAQVLVDADIFVFPSYYGEGCPISLLEAMAAGLAVITTSAGGISDIFTDAENGILLKSLSPVQIADAIEILVRDEHRQTEIRARNKQQAWDRYEATRVTHLIEGIYESVVDKTNPRNVSA
jgi:glycosyltransferase involved in cell wall biosynthesis